MRGFLNKRGAARQKQLHDAQIPHYANDAGTAAGISGPFGVFALGNNMGHEAVPREFLRLPSAKTSGTAIAETPLSKMEG